MDEKRAEARMLCADLVEVEWRGKSGKLESCVMNLEDISLSGACVQSDHQLHRGASLCIHYGNGTLPGIVRYCVYRDTGYFLGVEFTDGCKWPTNQFRPKHLLDPRKLVGRAVRRDTQAN
jgi:hypothetical protein